MPRLKAGFVSIVSVLAVEYTCYRIRADAILPGWIETDMNSPMLGLKQHERSVMSRIPQKRRGIPDDYCCLEVYLYRPQNE
jgi:NAD(P)-dependent dehydrogenase (short-subunit alcohol dehydrogenase family)